MPPAVVTKWAKESGFSTKEAERRWEKAKRLASGAGRNPEVTDQPEDWRYVMGIFKSMMSKNECKKPKKSKKREDVDALIDKVLEGSDPSDVLSGTSFSQESTNG